ncbi:MAG: hypothetical protein ACM3L6_04680 [Deltaproteobacteria bacterium]
MKKNLPVIIAVVVVLVIAGIVIASVAGHKKQGGTAPAAVKAGAKATVAAPKPQPTRQQIKQARTLDAALAEAQKLYDAKDYAGALNKCKDILANIDSTSQLAKNLRQMAQIRLLDQRRAGATP